LQQKKASFKDIKRYDLMALQVGLKVNYIPFPKLAGLEINKSVDFTEDEG
jgi:hypothetical protein